MFLSDFVDEHSVNAMKQETLEKLTGLTRFLAMNDKIYKRFTFIS